MNTVDRIMSLADDYAGADWDAEAEAIAPDFRAALLSALQELAAPQEPVAFKPTEAAIEALRRFEETCEDGEGYDVPKETMRQLAMIGLVRHTSAGQYTITDFGQHILAAPQPAQPVEPTIKESLTVHASAEDYLRYKYGAYRGHFAWRELGEAYSQGRYDEEQAQGPSPWPDDAPELHYKRGYGLALSDAEEAIDDECRERVVTASDCIEIIRNLGAEPQPAQEPKP